MSVKLIVAANGVVRGMTTDPDPQVAKGDRVVEFGDEAPALEGFVKLDADGKSFLPATDDEIAAARVDPAKEAERLRVAREESSAALTELLKAAESDGSPLGVALARYARALGVG